MSLPRTWTVVVAALFMSACSSDTPRNAPAAQPFSDFDLLTVEQSACLFDCPVFEVSIQSDGLVRHSGPSFDTTGGPITSRTDRNGLTQIAQALRDAGIDDMRDRYQSAADGCEHAISDMSTLYFMVSREQGERIKTVALDIGCIGPHVPTERINALIKAIDRVTGTGALLEQRKRAKTGSKPAS